MVALLLLLGGAAVAGPGAPPPRKLTPAEIAPYPPMQWHSWGLFTSDDLVNEANMEEMAEALVSSGMAAAGYDTLNVVCNGWVGRDPKTGVLLENRTLWPSGIAGFARRLHAMSPPLKVGCYTSPRSTNCMCGSLPQGGCEEGTGSGYEERDMEFFAASGCDHVMVDMPDTAPDTFKARYEKIGGAIRESSNPNMLYGVLTIHTTHAYSSCVRGVWCSSYISHQVCGARRATPNAGLLRPGGITGASRATATTAGAPSCDSGTWLSASPTSTASATKGASVNT